MAETEFPFTFTTVLATFNQTNGQTQIVLPQLLTPGLVADVLGGK
jgi:hypothetical protein